jgi:glycosyltransferase involved in cell wall biosynthesis
MDVFLFPSFMEGLSLSMLEAQSAGLPCIASDTIPREVEMTDLITFYPLKKSPLEWAIKVLSAASKPINRSIYPQKIKDAGYDICQNAQWLQNYYLSLLN